MKYKGQGTKEWIVKRNGLVTKLLTSNQAYDAFVYFKDLLKYENTEMIHIGEYLQGVK